MSLIFKLVFIMLYGFLLKTFYSNSEYRLIIIINHVFVLGDINCRPFRVSAVYICSLQNINEMNVELPLQR